MTTDLTGQTGWTPLPNPIQLQGSFMVLEGLLPASAEVLFRVTRQ